jgi:hypothetical protein
MTAFLMDGREEPVRLFSATMAARMRSRYDGPEVAFVAGILI